MKKQHYRLPESPSCFLLVTPSPAGVTTILPSNNINVFPVFAWVATGIPWHASLSLWGRKTSAAASHKGPLNKGTCVSGSSCLCHYTLDPSLSTRKALGDEDSLSHKMVVSSLTWFQIIVFPLLCSLHPFPPPLKPLSHSGWCAFRTPAVISCGLAVPDLLGMSVHAQTAIVDMVLFTSKGFLRSYRLTDMG